MITVTRLEWEACDAHNCHCDIVESKDGDMVNYEDYAALEKKLTDMAVHLANAESKCRELAAECSTIKVMNDCLSEELRGYESDGAFEGPKMHLLWWKTETPATDAVLAEVRAQGVEMFAHDVGESDQGNGLMKAIGRRAIKFAAQLRKGVQS